MNNFPKLHNAMWPGLVGKGPGSEPFIDLDTMLNLTAMAESDGARFEGVDLFLSDPHISIDSTVDQLKELAEKIAAKALGWVRCGAGLATYRRRIRDGEVRGPASIC
jgi:hypothetical protein